ncbi:MAG: phosphotransferase, partial [Pseudomonas putida]
MPSSHFAQQSSARIDVSDAHEVLSAYLQERLHGQPVRITHSGRLSGGAIQENWLIKAEVAGVPQRWVLRTDAASAVAASMSREQEFAVLSAAHHVGVKVPQPLWLCQTPQVIGRDFFIMQALAGHAGGHRLTSSQRAPEGNPGLCRALGANLARLHQLRPPQAALAFLPAPV